MYVCGFVVLLWFLKEAVEDDSGVCVCMCISHQHIICFRRFLHSNSYSAGLYNWMQNTGRHTLTELKENFFEWRLNYLNLKRNVLKLWMVRAKSFLYSPLVWLNSLILNVLSEFLFPFLSTCFPGYPGLCLELPARCGGERGTMSML